MTPNRRKTADRSAEAAAIADGYQIILSEEDGQWFGRGLELPAVFGGGKTPQACIADVREALRGAVAYLLETGKTPPRPAREAKRTEQVNVRLTPEERARAEAAARQRGFKGLSDYFRSAALESSGD
jgi:predicted RNase H-like HicB family nuclease